MKTNKQVLAVMAHPDDVESLCAGTLALLKKKGHKIRLATMTAGDCGSAEFSPEETSRIRMRESARAAAVLDATYDCVGCRDLLHGYPQDNILDKLLGALTT